MALALGDHVHAYVSIHTHILISLLQDYRNKKAADPTLYSLLQCDRITPNTETWNIFIFSYLMWLTQLGVVQD